MAKTKVDAAVSLDEVKTAMKFLKTCGGRESIQEYLKPLQEFIAYFGSLERFDYVLKQATEALGLDPVAPTAGVTIETADEQEPDVDDEPAEEQKTATEEVEAKPAKAKKGK